MSEKPATLEIIRETRATPTESTTEIRITYVQRDDYTIAVLTLENPEGRPATLGPASLDNLEAALLALDLSTVDAVALTGTGSIFCAGADLRELTGASTPRDAEEVARRGLDVFHRLEALPVPTFAFINGAALGGGLELALHTNYRVACESVRALGFPEVRLGLLPGWGGIPRTIALLGSELAARLVITDSLAGKNLTASAAADAGLIDAVLPGEDFLAASLEFTVGLLSGNISKPRAAGFTDESSFEVSGPALEGVKAQLDARFKGAIPAPYRALELMAAGSVTPAAQIRAFGELLLSDQARASIYAFYVTQSLAKAPTGRPTAEPLAVRSIGVVGAGLMASQLALVFARQLRVPVRITDLSQERVEGALQWVGGQLSKLVQRGHLDPATSEDIRALVTGGTAKGDLAGCDIVIEAVFEELEVKRAVFAELERLVRPDTLLLTNTSSLSIEAMGAVLSHPERLVGFHFFNPVAVLPLVEIITTPQTNESTLATAFELAKRLRKTAVLVTDTAGFVVNRVLTRLFSEVLTLIDQGADPMTVDHALDPVGLPMTPLRLLQFIGPAVQLHICEMMQQTYPERFGLSSSLKELVAAGIPGYLTDDGGISPAAASLLPPPEATDVGVVRSRILTALVTEVTAMLDEGVVAGPEQIDVCMILGANYPFHTGGLTPLLDREAGTTFHPGLRVAPGADYLSKENS
ncbi:3-hydroxyacyl-CoA dehydrogenase [Arthrobacter sp. CDRTa11]|uniref:3-hydroxyacyl-CoA dehydrogenase NAD-binding domain-containing protein n=1 Tax=Arthrobacter sp. CDRTa11 TaxID=2651199 RepID=UPI0022658229|nr:3-hydroxyacyl-CoA dehydrogenase NAD-binding domain-containing protein [Arthrobacter sp. CDRTa11]UZX02834.1 3-hydroxyacyl-CoA dehydrogenase [Arthrobacter sp. CDRTa11]